MSTFDFISTLEVCIVPQLKTEHFQLIPVFHQEEWHPLKIYTFLDHSLQNQEMVVWEDPIGSVIDQQL